MLILREFGSNGITHSAGVVIVVVIGGILAACNGQLNTGADDGSPDEEVGDASTDTEGISSGETPIPVLSLRPLPATADLRIIDDLNRDVLLRGVNITSLGEYWQGDPTQPPTLPTTESDWQAMASLGVSSVRLVVHWSRIEPERGVIDADYLDAIDDYVTAAAAHGIYTVIDMHQDAYTAAIFTPSDEICPEGTHPAKGWDGAPKWAVYTDGLSTCTPGDRNASPAVQAAWNYFYDNHDGIRDHFVSSWAAVAARFAGRAEVAGYDLINEPEVPRPSAELTPLYDQLLFDTVAAIREAESQADFQHLVFIEPAIPAGNPDFGLVIPDPLRIGLDTENLVSAPHNYAETIGIPGIEVTFEEMNELLLLVASTFGVPTWIGEYGFWSTSTSTLEKLARYAADEDRRLLGGTWWQWRQPCGDPHSIGPTGEYEVVHLNRLGCPGDIELGQTEEFVRVLSRGYPRAAPGRLVSLSSDPSNGLLMLEATAFDAGGELVVWTPTTEATHHVGLVGLSDLRALDVSGGRILFATVDAPGPYSLRVEPKR